MKSIAFLLAIVLITINLCQVDSQDATECNQRKFDYDSFVCVCDSTSCDMPGTIIAPDTPGDFLRVISDAESQRFNQAAGKIETKPTATGTTFLRVNYRYEYQSMLGFGGAFTDSTGINVAKLPQAAQDFWTSSYFAPEGIEYNLCRIPIGGSDFSTRPYSYDDNNMVPDPELENWALEPEDNLYKLPYIAAAQNATGAELLFMASPWAPPAWMKTNQMFNGTGGLIRSMWDPYSNYLVKFVQEYESRGVPIWGITPQNEPTGGFGDWPFNTCAFSETEMRDWIVASFGPAMAAADLRRVKVMVLDFNRDSLPWYPAACYENKTCNNYVDGTAMHWYSDGITSTSLSDIQSMFPDKFLLYTEACEGWIDHQVNLGDWSRAENYVVDILDDVNHFSAGWVDWNMALSMTGGPNWSNNWVDSPTIVNEVTGEFYKQPTFYAMGHFSKFIQRDAKRVYSRIDTELGFQNADVSAAVFHNPDGTRTYVILNKSTEPQDVSINVDNLIDGSYINIKMGARSLETILMADL